jgi:hypothetical protein
VDRWEWHEQELARSPRFCDEIDKARTEAFAPRRSSDVLASYASLDAIRSVVKTALDAPRDEHPYRWREERVERMWLAAPHDPLSHASRYAQHVQKLAHHYVGATIAAEQIHLLVRQGSGYQLDLAPLRPLGGEAPIGHAASMCAAHLNGASWGSPDAQRQAHWRAFTRKPGADPADPEVKVREDFRFER